MLGSFLITAAYAFQDLQQIGNGLAYGSKFSGADFPKIVVFDKTLANLDTRRDGVDGSTRIEQKGSQGCCEQAIVFE